MTLPTIGLLLIPDSVKDVVAMLHWHSIRSIWDWFAPLPTQVQLLLSTDSSL